MDVGRMKDDTLNDVEESGKERTIWDGTIGMLVLGNRILFKLKKICKELERN